MTQLASRPAFVVAICALAMMMFILSGDDKQTRFATMVRSSHRNSFPGNNVESSLGPTGAPNEPLPIGTSSDVVNSNDNFFWSGGGVAGACEGAANAALDRLQERLLPSLQHWLSVRLGLSAKELKRHLKQIKPLVSELVANTNSDCLRRLNPHEVLLCHMWAAHYHERQPESSGTNTTASGSSPGSIRRHLFSGVALDSMCSLFLACLTWKRGRYSTRLSHSLLTSTFEAVRTAQKQQTAAGGRANSPHVVADNVLRQLVHGGENWEEYKWLAQRFESSDKWQQGQSNAVGGGRAEGRVGAHAAAPLHDARPFFQGGDVTVLPRRLLANASPSANNHGRSVRDASHVFAFRDNGQEHAVGHFAPLTSLEMLSILHHRATHRHTPHDASPPVLYPAQSTSEGAAVSTPLPPRERTRCSPPPINVLLFQGDSIIRQLFGKLLDYIRRGVQQDVRVPYMRSEDNGTTTIAPQKKGKRDGDSDLLRLQTRFDAWPLLDLPQYTDVVLAVYPSHDDLHFFRSVLQSPGSASPSHAIRPQVNEFFANLSSQRRREYCDEGGGVRGGVGKTASRLADSALFYLVLLVDTITALPRTDGLAPCHRRDDDSQPLSTELDNYRYPWVRDAALRLDRRYEPTVVPLRTLGVRIGLHVHGANMWERRASPVTYNWLARMGSSSACTANQSSAKGSDAEQPHDDDTHLYLLSSQLFPEKKAAKRNVMMVPSTAAQRVTPRWGNNSVSDDKQQRMPAGFPHNRAALEAAQLGRVAFPFEWLLNVSRIRSALDTGEEHRHQRNNSFFSKVRVLDMSKVFQAAGHVIQTIDGFHEGCTGRGWLVGAATQAAATTEALDRTATRLMRKMSPLVPAKEYEWPILIGYKRNLFYTANVDCSRLGSVLTLNALALDIVVGK